MRAAAKSLVTLAACALCVGADAVLAEARQGLPRPPAAGLTVVVRDADGRAIAGATVNVQIGSVWSESETSAEGIARIADLLPGVYAVRASFGGSAMSLTDVSVDPGRIRNVTVVLAGGTLEPRAAPAVPGGAIQTESPPASDLSSSVPPARTAPSVPGALAPGDKVFVPLPDRWNVAMPEWDRYGVDGDYPYVAGHWWDPYNRNLFKGDYPIIGQRTFFAFTGVVDTLIEGRNLPTQAGPSSARPLSTPFFGRGDQYLPVGAYRFSFDLFHGDTAFRPVDWRVRIQPAISTNYFQTRETGAVNADVRGGRGRFDAHAGLQEAFVEKKLFDLGANYDFLSIRAGIQELSTDFRGFIAVVEQPGVRVFGTLRSSRIEYNAAVFDFLEKDTNSGFNEWSRRRQQLAVGNVYVQDFLRPGYTIELSVHHARDQGEPHYDANGFLVRPAPIGVVAAHAVSSTYVGVAGNGHLGRLNVSHALYQAFGTDDLNPIEGRRVSINAQMAALDLSADRDWLRLRGGLFWASGDDNPNDGRGRGFDAVLDVPAFAGGAFSVWNREGVRLPQTGTGLVSPLSLLPSLRTNKDEGQQNFVNPGILIAFTGASAELTPKLRGFANVSYLRFQHTEPLEALLFQSPIHKNVGVDMSAGAQYRPPLSDNIVLSAGLGVMKLGQGMRDIYDRRWFTTMSGNLRLQF